MKGILSSSFGYKSLLTLSMIAIGLGSSVSTLAQYCADGEQETILSVAGSLDTSFDPGLGANNIITNVIEQPDGKILIAGAFTSYNGTARNRIARLKPDGSIDTSFNPGLGANSTIISMAVQADGKIIIGGAFNSYNGTTRRFIARLKDNGELDTSFDPGLGANNIINDIVIQHDGKIIIGGNFTDYDGNSINRIARLKDTGVLDSSFNPGAGADGSVNSIALQADGFIVIGGTFGIIDGITHKYIARLKDSGVLDSSFNGATDNTINDIKIQHDGKIIIGGNFTSYNGTPRKFLARLNSDASIDNNFDQGPNGAVYDIKIQSNGKILIGGAFTDYNGNTRNNITRINSDSSLDSSFDPGDGGSNATILSLAIQSDGKILIGGYFTSVDSTNRNRIARLNKEDIQCSIPISTCGIANLGFTSDFPSTGLCSVGIPYLQQIGSVTLGIAGELDTSFDPGTAANNSVSAIALQPDGKIIIGGNFTSYNGTTRNRLARVNADGSLDTSFDPGTGPNNQVMSIVIQPDGKILIGGSFTDYNGNTRNRLARVNADGSLDSSFNPGTGPNNQVIAIALQPDGKIVAGGLFTTHNGVSRNRITRVNTDGSLDSSFSPGTALDRDVRAVVIQPDGKILIGGAFILYNGTSRSRIARVNTDGSLDSSFNPGTVNSTIVAIALQPDGKILIGGSFTIYNGTSRNRIAKANADGSLDSSFNPGTALDSAISDIVIQSDGTALIGGSFTTYSGTSRNRLARVNADGSLDSSFNPGTGLDNIVSDIVIQPNGKILIGGFFSSYNGTSRNRIARVNHYTSNITSYTWSCNAIGGGTPVNCISYQIPSAGTTCSPYTGNISNYNYSVAFSGDQIGVLLNSPNDSISDSGRVLHTTGNSITISGIVAANAYLSIDIQNLKTGNPQSQFVQYRSTTQNGGGNTVGGGFYGCVSNERLPSNPLTWNGASIGSNGSFYISQNRGTVTANDITSQFLAWSRPNEGFKVTCELCIGAAAMATQTGSCTGLPANAVVNTATSIIQFNDNGTWVPSTQYTYNVAGSLASCNFKCDTNYMWNGSACVGSGIISSCGTLPANTTANTATSINQTWNGSIWTPSTGYSYNLTPSTTSCNFTCAANYTRNGSACIADTQNIACSIDSLPDHAIVNTATSINQTWNGRTWMPSTGYEFNLTPSTTSCNFKCDTGYTRDGNECVAFNPISTVACGSLSSVVQGTQISTNTANTCSGSSLLSGTVSNVGFGINGCNSAQGCVQWQCGNGSPSENVACMIPYTLNACGGATTFTDPRDNKVYNIVDIDGKCWFKEPLRYEDPEVVSMNNTEAQLGGQYPSDEDFCSSSNQNKQNEEINDSEEAAGCVNLNIRDQDGFGYIRGLNSPTRTKLRNVITYSQFTTRNTTPPSRTQSTLPANIKNTLLGNAATLGYFVPSTYTASWGNIPSASSTLGVYVNYGPNYPYVPSANYISDSSYTALKNAGATGLSGSSAIPTDVKAMCQRFWPGVTQNQIIKAGYLDSYSIICTKTSGTAPHSLTVPITPDTLQVKSFAYDDLEFYNNLSEFCPIGWRPPFENDYNTLPGTGRQMLDLRQRLNRNGQYSILANPMGKEIIFPVTQPLFVANGSWLEYIERNDSNSYNIFGTGSVWVSQSTTPAWTPNRPTTKEMRCIKDTSVTSSNRWKTGSYGACLQNACTAPYGNYLANGSSGAGCYSNQGAYGGAAGRQKTRNVSCGRGSNILDEKFCASISKPTTTQSCVPAQGGGQGGLQGG